MKSYFLTLTAMLAFGLAQAQTADEIIAKHVDAIGGKEKLSQLTSVYLESGTEVMGNESASKTTVLVGKGFKSESDFNGQKIVQVVTDKSGWAVNPFGGEATATALPEEQYKAAQDQLYMPDPLFNYAAHSGKAELQGQEKVGAVNAYKIKYTNKDKGETVYYIDPSSYYVIQAVKTGNAGGQEMKITANYSDYKKTDFGVYLPYTTSMDLGQFQLKSIVKKIEINKAVDPAIFAMPK